MTGTDPAIAWLALERVLGLFAFGAVLIAIMSVPRRRLAPATGLIEEGDVPELVRAEAAPAKKVPLWIRFGTLAVLAAAVLVPAWIGPYSFAGVTLVIVAAAMHEFWGMLAAGGIRAHRFAGLLGALGLVAAAFVGGPAGLGLGFLAFLSVLLPLAAFRGELETLPARAGGTLLGVAYVGGLAACWVLMRHADPGGFGRILFFLMVIQLADAFGLVGGLAFGKHPLAPRLSPGKTLEGTLGSALAAVAGAWLFAFALPTTPLPQALATGLALFVAALIGDLVASAFKRAVGLKDFGQTLPGHGGLLDRFDGYLLAAPLGWALLVWLPGYLGH